MTSKNKYFFINVTAHRPALLCACFFAVNIHAEGRRKAYPASQKKRNRSPRCLHPRYPQLLLYPLTPRPAATHTLLANNSAAAPLLPPLRRQQLCRKLNVYKNDEKRNKNQPHRAQKTARERHSTTTTGTATATDSEGAATAVLHFPAHFCVPQPSRLGMITTAVPIPSPFCDSIAQAQRPNLAVLVLAFALTLALALALALEYQVSDSVGASVSFDVGVSLSPGPPCHAYG